MVAEGVLPPVFHKPSEIIFSTMSLQRIGSPASLSTWAAASRPLGFFSFGVLVLGVFFVLTVASLLARGAWLSARPCSEFRGSGAGPRRPWALLMQIGRASWWGRVFI